MVSSLLVDTIADPIGALQDLYKELTDATARDAFPEHVASRFSGIFATHTALAEIPIIDVDNPPTNHKHGALVRFTAMIQDTSMSPEVYLTKLSDGGLGGWGIIDETHGGHNVDYNDLQETSVVWAVTIPGESSHVLTDEPIQAHKYPIPGVKHVGIKVKIYDSQGDSFRATDIVTFVGILSSEPIHVDLDESTSTFVPTLHTLFSRPQGLIRASSSPLNLDLRSRIISWIATEALSGDEVAAEWVLLSCLAKVQSRTPPILPHTLCLTRFPPPSVNDPTTTPALYQVISLLFPYVTTIPLSLPVINTTPFSPESRNEDLHSGWLQLPKGSICIVNETGVKEGTVTEAGLLNLHRMQEMISSQSLEYIFPFSKFSFDTDVDFVLLSEGKKSAFFQNVVVMPLAHTKPGELYKPVSRPDDIELFREFVCSAKAGQVAISDEAAKHIQEDFVTERQESKMTTDDFIQGMALARLVAVSWGERDITKEIWEKMKVLDGERKRRL